MDLWVSDSKYNRLMKNAGQLQFKDVTQQAGHLADWRRSM